ncbi:preprotein translocase subunit SecE [Blochmannia endosymbiont of Camponotus sp.]|uniref:preprotein translocase subunit SecE n=1 Tax=Blochmannia endosymbiont of Camponotus sp. TaxID=700220 RepID=UPI0020244E5D|nr:preprotein translocase subunit SecE [Blochmannia endosymbiont of Camponotus sp.]URJ29849.1 preprotein translocase subunit SecE [Blochmannia endosymbiont of Camponotus sp.]
MHIENKNKKNTYILEVTKWISIIGLVSTSIIGNYLYRDYNAFVRGAVVFIIITAVTYIASTTKIGKLIVIFGNDSRTELRKVVWPTYRDGFNTTLIVIGVTIVISLLLWGLDTILVHLISFSLRL